MIPVKSRLLVAGLIWLLTMACEGVTEPHCRPPISSGPPLPFTLMLKNASTAPVRLCVVGLNGQPLGLEVRYRCAGGSGTSEPINYADCFKEAICGSSSVDCGSNYDCVPLLPGGGSLWNVKGFVWTARAASDGSFCRESMPLPPGNYLVRFRAFSTDAPSPPFEGEGGTGRWIEVPFELPASGPLNIEFGL